MSSSSPIPRAIEGFAQDEQGDWIARLSCGHTQHVRHRPPLVSRPWVATEAGRASMLGTELGCALCLMPELPDGLVERRRTPVFDADTVPAGLLRSHSTKADTWGEIHVTHGHVDYVIEASGLSFALRRGVCGVIEPGALHHVRPQPGARFFVRFLVRAP